MPIQPLERSANLKERAYIELRRLILNRVLLPGEPVTEVALSTSLGISRTPIRQALSRLTSDGLLVESRGRLQVRSITPKETGDIAQLRLAIEGHTVRLLAERTWSPSEMSEVLTTNQKMESSISRDGTSSDLPLFFKLNREFHAQLARLTDNELLVQATEHALDLFILGGLNALGKPNRAVEVVNEHSQILSAVMRGESEKAFEVVSLHVLGNRPASTSPDKVIPGVLEHLEEGER